MDAQRFDDVTRALAGGISRRGVLKGIAVALVATALGRAATGDAAAACPPGAIRSRGRCLCKTTGRPPVNGACPCPRGQITCPDGIGCREGNCCTDADCPTGQGCFDNGCTPIPVRAGLGEDCSSATCQDGLLCVEDQCVCPSSLSPDVSSDPINCGACGNRCQVFDVCIDGECRCNGGIDGCSGDVPICRADGLCACAEPGSVNFVDIAGSTFVGTCPDGTSPCIGAVCQVCCPNDSACDTQTGACFPII